MSEAREPLRRTFDSAADLYDAARPAYPTELFEDLVTLTGLQPGSRLLEVGCATGIATRPASRPRLQRRLHRAGPTARTASAHEPRRAAFRRPRRRVRGVGGRARDIRPRLRGDRVALDRSGRRLPECASPAPAGRSARLLERATCVPRRLRPFFSEIQAVYDTIGEGHDGEWPPPAPERIEDQSAQIEASGLFDDIRTCRYVREVRERSASSRVGAIRSRKRRSCETTTSVPS